jgi:hypothetical protein
MLKASSRSTSQDLRNKTIADRAFLLRGKMTGPILESRHSDHSSCGLDYPLSDLFPNLVATESILIGLNNKYNKECHINQRFSHVEFPVEIQDQDHNNLLQMYILDNREIYPNHTQLPFHNLTRNLNQ